MTNKKSQSILRQKVKNVMIMVELENGQSLVARPSEIGKMEGIVTLKDIQKLMSNSDAPDDMKFQSPFVFALDLQDAAREWIKHLEEFENKEYSQEVGFDRMINKHYYHKELLEEWILHFFNLGESE